MTLEEFQIATNNYISRNGSSHFSIKAALIDMDGVLYDSMPYHTLSWQKMISEQGVACSRDEFYLYEGMTGAATINLIWQREFGHTLSSEEVKRLYKVKTEYFKAFPQPDSIPGTSELFQILERHDIKRVLVTGSAQNTLLQRIDSDFPGAFLPEMRITALDVTNGKPNPEPYLRGLERSATKATETIVVENAPLGVKAGHAAGCFTIAVATGPIPAAELYNAGADIVFPTMKNFTDTLAKYLDA